jgi:S-adenosylmethionine decarboxylase
MRVSWIAQFKDHVSLRFREDRWPSADVTEERVKGSFVKRNGKHFAGTHLIVDFFHAANLDQIERIRAALIEATRVSGATLLQLHLHCFSEEGGGVSGVAVLAESHISVHTWPQYGYAALDLFMCGSTNPYLAIPVLRNALAPKRVRVQELLRGQVRGLDMGP